MAVFTVYMNFDKLDNTYSPMNEQHDVSEELLGIALAPMDDATSMMGMALSDGWEMWGYSCGNGLVPFFHAPGFVPDLAFIVLRALFTPGV